MPRTKVSKSSKRNREASQREEKLREAEAALEQHNNVLDSMFSTEYAMPESDIKYLMLRINPRVLQMKFADFRDMKLKHFTDFPTNYLKPAALGKKSMHQHSVKTLNPNDEGYLTEDSANSVSTTATLAAFSNLSHLQLEQHQQRGRTPGPLNSARARRPRRSKSACSDMVPGSAIKSKPPTLSAADHASRSKLRTPMSTRTKAYSADRSSKVCPSVPESPPSAFMRWPKPGEIVLSMCGSPVVAQVMPDKFANVNIPMRNGVLSLRPKKIHDLQPEMIEGIDKETLNQIKTLHANLNMIMTMADKAGYN